MFIKKKQDVFLAVLARMAHNLERSGALLSGLVRGEEMPGTVTAALHGLRTSQQDCQGRLLDALAGAFVTPLDGQDLFNLSLGLGRILNDVAGVAGCLNLSGGWRARPNLAQLASCAEESLREASRAVGCLARRDRPRVVSATARLHQVQDRADEFLWAGLREADGAAGVRETVWQKDIYTALTGIIRSCAEAVQTIHWVILHNA